MPIIHLENIPSCFKTEGLYTQLIENADQLTVELPEKYATFDATPTIDTLINQLETVRFWCIPEMPQYVFESITMIGDTLVRDPKFTDYLETYESKYRLEIRYMLKLDYYNYGPLATCAVYGFAGYFRYLYQKTYLKNTEKAEISKKWAIKCNDKLLSSVVRCQKLAAQHDQQAMLEILLDIHLCGELLPRLIEMAAMGGHSEIMHYLFAVFGKSPNKIKWTKTTCYMAAKRGSLPCLRLARENGAPCDYLVVCAAAEHGNYECYKYLCDTGCTLSVNSLLLNQHTCNGSCYTMSSSIHTTMSYCMWKHNSCNLAAANGHYEILKYGLEHGSYTTNSAIVYAAKYSHEQCLYYLVDIAMEKWTGVSVPYMAIVISFIIRNNRLDILSTIYEKHRYCPFEPEHPNQAAATGNYDLVCYIIEKMKYQQQEYHNNVCRYACQASSTDCIKKLVENGFTMGIDCIYAAAEHGTYSVFRYVMQNIDYSEVNPNTIYHDLVKRGEHESMKYFHSLGFEIPKKSVWYCIIAGDYSDSLDFLVENTRHINELVCQHAVQNNRLLSLKLLHEKYWGSLHGCLYWAVVNNNISICKYLWECGEKEITWEMYQIAVRKKYTEIRTFIETNVNINSLCRKSAKKPTHTRYKNYEP